MPRLTSLGLTSMADVHTEIQLGSTFVRYHYCISALVITFRRPSDVFVVRRGESRVWEGMPYTLLSLVAGWWGFPWGLIYTPICIYRNLRGGTDITADILASR